MDRRNLLVLAGASTGGMLAGCTRLADGDPSDDADNGGNDQGGDSTIHYGDEDEISVRTDNAEISFLPSVDAGTIVVVPTRGSAQLGQSTLPWSMAFIETIHSSEVVLNEGEDSIDVGQRIAELEDEVADLQAEIQSLSE